MFVNPSVHLAHLVHVVADILDYQVFCWREMDVRPGIRWVIGPVTEEFLSDHVQLPGWLGAGSGAP